MRLCLHRELYHILADRIIGRAVMRLSVCL